MSSLTFNPVHLAITLPKGFSKEYKDRDWFDQIYFSKLGMSHSEEGYTPILYQFEFQHEQDYDTSLPNQMLMTFYYPETRRVSNLNGIVVIGAEPDLYDAYQTTITLTPHMESLVIDKYDISSEATITLIDETLKLLSNPQRIRPIEEIVERSVGRENENLASFFPILDDSSYNKTKLVLPLDFGIDAVFVFKIDPEFFTAEQPGQGTKTIELYHHKDSSISITPDLAFPLVLKWQPLYNDILGSLKESAKSIIPGQYSGRIIPEVVIFNSEKNANYTALFSSISMVDDQLYYHVAVANSGKKEGQPLSHLQSALSREKFGSSSWIDRVRGISHIPEDSIRDHEYAEDHITTRLEQVVDEKDITTEEKFDLGKLKSIKINQS